MRAKEKEENRTNEAAVVKQTKEGKEEIGRGGG